MSENPSKRAISRPFRVGIFADLPKGIGGGVNGFSKGLLTGLLSRKDPEFHYVVFLAGDNDEWGIETSSRVSIVRTPLPSYPSGWSVWTDRFSRYSSAAGWLARGDSQRARVTRSYRWRQRQINEGLRRSPWPLDALHFPIQDIAITNTPLIFSPWDLQHLHLKDLWPKRTASSRDAYYRLGCRLARRVVVASQWAQEDIITRYNVPRSRITTVRVAAPTQLTPNPTLSFTESVKRKYDLPDRFIFYPAVTWKHKNHHRLISALALVRSLHPDLHLICAGRTGQLLPDLLAHARRSGLDDRVRFLGHILDTEVRSLYRLAESCILPSLFEGAGLPVLEAFGEGCPVATGKVTCVSEYAGDAALFFNPHDVRSIADAILHLASSLDVRADLASRGSTKAREYSWDRVASDFIGLYREITGVSR